MENEEKLELETELRVYEVGYLLLPFIQEADLATQTALIKEQIAKAGGAVFSDEDPRLITLAYPMFKMVSNKKTKFENAYFGWVKFDGDPKTVAEIKKSIEALENVLRFTIIKTIRENTLIKKPSYGSKPIAKPIMKEKEPAIVGVGEKKEEAPKEVVNEVELDKELEGLVIE
jgi:ribosomal protein S6